MILAIIQIILLLGAIFILGLYLIINFAINRASLSSGVPLPRIWAYLLPFNLIFILGTVLLIIIQLLSGVFPIA